MAAMKMTLLIYIKSWLRYLGLTMLSKLCFSVFIVSHSNILQSFPCRTSQQLYNYILHGLHNDQLQYTEVSKSQSI
uniref:Putative secreted protein n=1 Tax=Rhipicephalus microplus TaxID=6941 RepID=A0A6G5A0J0_RHIMP